MDTEFTVFDGAEYLDSEEAIEEYVIGAFETEDPAFIAHALGVIARAKNMTSLAEQAGMSRPALYEAFSGKVNPEFGTIAKIMKALGLKMLPVSEKEKTAA